MYEWECSPIKCITFLSEQENTILPWAFSLNSALAIAENWHLKGYIYEVCPKSNASDLK